MVILGYVYHIIIKIAIKNQKQNKNMSCFWFEKRFLLRSCNRKRKNVSQPKKRRFGSITVLPWYVPGRTLPRIQQMGQQLRSCIFPAQMYYSDQCAVQCFGWPPPGEDEAVKYSLQGRERGIFMELSRKISKQITNIIVRRQVRKACPAVGEGSARLTS